MHIKLNSSYTNIQLEIYNQQGQKIYTHSNQDLGQEILINNLSSGIYMIKYIVDQEVVVKRIVILN